MSVQASVKNLEAVINGIVSRGVKEMCVADGHLMMTLTDDTVVDLGQVTGEKGDPGSAGKTAYQSALDGGYSGTEAAFYSDLAVVSAKQEMLISGTNIKTVNSQSLLGPGNLVIGGGGGGSVDSVNGKTGAVVLNASDVGAQETLVSGSNIKTINSQSLLGSGNIVIGGGGGGNVDSVNGKTGTVVLNAQDVGALSSETVIPTKTSDLTNDSGFLTQHQSLAAYRTASAQNTIDAGKQDAISDLAAIRSGAEAGASAYQKPSGGIPKTDLASAVQTSLERADSALQAVPNTYRTASEQDVIDGGKQAKITVSGLLKADGSGNVTAAVSGTDYTSASDLNTRLNRSTAVTAADTDYTTYMVRGEALYSYTTTPIANGQIAWIYS